MTPGWVLGLLFCNPMEPDLMANKKLKNDVSSEWDRNAPPFLFHFNFFRVFLSRFPFTLWQRRSLTLSSGVCLPTTVCTSFSPVRWCVVHSPSWNGVYSNLHPLSRCVLCSTSVFYCSALECLLRLWSLRPSPLALRRCDGATFPSRSTTVRRIWPLCNLMVRSDNPFLFSDLRPSLWSDGPSHPLWSALSQALDDASNSPLMALLLLCFFIVFLLIDWLLMIHFLVWYIVPYSLMMRVNLWNVVWIFCMMLFADFLLLFFPISS